MVNSSPRLSYFFPLRETFLSGDERGETSAVRRLEFSMGKSRSATNFRRLGRFLSLNCLQGSPKSELQEL